MCWPEWRALKSEIPPDRLAIDHKLLPPTRQGGFDNPWKTLRPIISPRVAIALNTLAVPVILDLVKLLPAGRNPGSLGRNAELNDLSMRLTNAAFGNLRGCDRHQRRPSNAALDWLASQRLARERLESPFAINFKPKRAIKVSGIGYAAHRTHPVELTVTR